MNAKPEPKNWQKDEPHASETTIYNLAETLHHYNAEETTAQQISLNSDLHLFYMSTRFAERRKSSAEQSTADEPTAAAKDNKRKDSTWKWDRKRVRVHESKALYNFLQTIKTLRCCLREGLAKYVIKSGRWLVRTDDPMEMIVVETEDGDLLVVHYNELRLNGRTIEKICAAGRCYTAHDIRGMVVAAISRLLY